MKILGICTILLSITAGTITAQNKGKRKVRRRPA